MALNPKLNQRSETSESVYRKRGVTRMALLCVPTQHNTITVPNRDHHNHKIFLVVLTRKDEPRVKVSLHVPNNLLVSF